MNRENRLQETGVFAELQAQLDDHELMLEKGTLIDASIKPASSRPPRTDRTTGERHPNRDADATWVTKNGESNFGYKVHIGMDLGSDLVKDVR